VRGLVFAVTRTWRR